MMHNFSIVMTSLDGSLLLQSSVSCSALQVKAATVREGQGQGSFRRALALGRSEGICRRQLGVPNSPHEGALC